MTLKGAAFLAIAVAYSSPSFADEQKLEGFDLSLAQTPPFTVTEFYDSGAYFQPVTRGELGRIFGKEVSRDTIAAMRREDLIESGPRSPARLTPM